MFVAAKRWFKRNRGTLLIGASVVGAGYLAGQYVLSKLHEARQRMSEERIAKENLRRRFEQNQEDCTYTVLALLPTVRDEIIGALPVEQISEQLQQERQERLKRLGASEAGSSEFPSAAPSTVGDDAKSLSSSFVHASQMVTSNPEVGAGATTRPRRTKAQLWQDMKINSISRALTLIYTLSLLTLLTRIQLNLLGRRTYLSSVVALASPPNPAQASTISLENNDDDNYENAYGNDFETNRKYLTFSWWLLHRGSKKIMERVMVAVKEVFGQVNIREDVSLESLADLIMKVRKIIEGATEEERRSNKWLVYLLPPKEEEIFVIRQSGNSSDSDGEAFSPELGVSDPLASSVGNGFDSGDLLINQSLRRLLDETADLIDSPTFSFVLTRILDTAFSHLVDYRIATESFHLPPPPHIVALQNANNPNAGGFPGNASPPRITEITSTTSKLAHILPVFCRQAHSIAVGSGELDALAGVAAQGALGNEYLAAIDRVPDLEAFAALVYSSNWEFEHPEFAEAGKLGGDAPAEDKNKIQEQQIRRRREREREILEARLDEELEAVEAEQQQAAAEFEQSKQREEQEQRQRSAVQETADQPVEQSTVIVQQEDAQASENQQLASVVEQAKGGMEAAWQKATAAVVPPAAFEQEPEQVQQAATEVLRTEIVPRIERPESLSAVPLQPEDALTQRPQTLQAATKITEAKSAAPAKDILPAAPTAEPLPQALPSSQAPALGAEDTPALPTTPTKQAE